MKKLEVFSRKYRILYNIADHIDKVQE